MASKGTAAPQRTKGAAQEHRGTGAMTLRSGRHTVRVNRPEKLLFPDDGLTKADLAAYYRSVAPRMLPHLRGRPLMLERHPDGIDGGTSMRAVRRPCPPGRARRHAVELGGGGRRGRHGETLDAPRDRRPSQRP